MAAPVLCLIFPLESGGRPDQGLPQPPLGIWGPTDPRPTPPIAPGGPGLGFWGGVAPPWVSHPIAPGGPPPRPDQGLPQPPPGYWGGVAPPHPDQGLPGPQPTPTPPIYLPPGSLPGIEHPIYIPPIVNIPGFPTHPIVIPNPPEKPEVLENWDVKTAWSATTGWVVAIVPSESHPGVPTPS